MAMREQMYAFGYASFTLSRIWQFPAGWPSLLAREVPVFGRHVERKGGGPGSLEDDATAGLNYYVMTTKDVKAAVPWLYRLYIDSWLTDIVAQIVGEPVHPSDGEDAINVNYLRGGGRYELHVDSDPYTLLLYASDTSPEHGGGLTLQVCDPPSDLTLYPSIGSCVVFDGHAVPHRVEPLIGEQPRISVPMLYLPSNRPRVREPGTDHYLYEA